MGAAVALHCSKMGDPGCTPTAITISQNGKGAYTLLPPAPLTLWNSESPPSASSEEFLRTGGYPDALGLVSGWLFASRWRQR